MKRWIIALLLLWTGIAGAQTTPPMCSITGNVANADGSAYVGVIKFYNPVVQVINNIPINPMQVSTGTNSSGVIQPISLPQGAFFQVTLCPSASAASGCAATFTAIVPASASANFGNMAMGTNLTPSVIASSLSVSGTTSLANTTISGPLSVSGATSLAATTITSLGVNMAPAAAAGQIQNTGNAPDFYGLRMTNAATGGHIYDLILGATGTGFAGGAGALNIYDETRAGTNAFWDSNGNLTQRANLSSLGTIWAQSPANGAANSDGMINNNVTFNIANGGSQELAALCSGAFIVTELVAGQTALYVCGGGVCTFLGASALGTWVASTTAPAAGKASVAMDGSNKYTLYNNMGAAENFMALTLCSRAGT